ncbi:tRNA-specific adenosine deaminase 1 [Penicillium ucsense]|uniref:tRNA-specific adenosine deaminase 1 n=1 Tax=Penicillium ucsense TaxID=2839758 RepID=A0A8J8WGE4_9EURO|nr:tRNA-specific adenosine deaminase 1 [Penicillium ucsense]KAF7734835.1 tRNA-specific adenosine deaminase 1 [Penicillium ucsense]
MNEQPRGLHAKRWVQAEEWNVSRDMGFLDYTRPLASRIASLVHAHFDRLPARSKPKIFADGSREWIPMTGIVAVKGQGSPCDTLHCIAVTTGAKCLPASQIPQCKGLVLHDCHAEILAIRAFNYWLLQECHALLVEEGKSPTAATDNLRSSFIQRRACVGTANSRIPLPRSSLKGPPFEIQPDIKFYMYCTCAPCGDASMELCMAAQEDATPWDVCHQTNSDDQDSTSETMLDGRAHFSRLGIVRRKPARMDAEPTKSKSCSDKLALRQVTSLFCIETSYLVAPTESAYLAGLVLPEEEISQTACTRSFGEQGRMGSLVGRSWPLEKVEGQYLSRTGYRFRPFQVLSVSNDEIQALWPFAKPKISQAKQGQRGQSAQPETIPPPPKVKPGNVSSIWTAAPSISHSCVLATDTGSKTLPVLSHSKTGLYETVINGVKQGNRQSNPTARGASSLSRAKLWGLLRNILQSTECLVEGAEESHKAHSEQKPEASPMVQYSGSYQEFKCGGYDPSSPLGIRQSAIQDARRTLGGWVPNRGDETWTLEVLVDSRKRKER